MTHTQQQLRERAIARLRLHADVLGRAFELPRFSIEPESERVRSRYGICYSDGRILIRLHQLNSGDMLKYSVMVDTLCHELAHLRHFNHGRRFWALYRRILAYARRRGIYRPGPEVSIAPVIPFYALPEAVQRADPRRKLIQLELFPGG